MLTYNTIQFVALKTSKTHFKHQIKAVQQEQHPEINKNQSSEQTKNNQFHQFKAIDTLI